MSDDSIKQEFLAELDAILESDEAYGSNIQVLTYSVKDEVVSGKFRDSWNNRVYEFIIDIDGIRYKPAVKLDSFSENELPIRFDAFSEGYSSLFDEARLDRNPIGKRVKKPKCGKEGYGCGFSCIGLAKTCRILASGQKTKGNFQERAIGKERLRKLLVLGDKISALGKKGVLIKASDIKDQITRERNRKAGQLVEARKEKLAQRQPSAREIQPAKITQKPQEKQPAKPKSDPTANPKTHSIKTQKEFEDVFYHVVDKLSKDAVGGNVRIAKVREAIGELIPRNKFNQYLKDLQGDDDVTLIAGSVESLASTNRETENAISTRVNGLRMLIKLEEKGRNKIDNLASEKKREIEKQLQARPDLDPLGSARQYTKGEKITSQKDFEETAAKIIQALNDEFNYNDLVPITKVRETLKERVSPENFDKMMVELQSDDKYQLMGYSGPSGQKAPKELEDGAIITKVNGSRHYIKKLAGDEKVAVSTSNTANNIQNTRQRKEEQEVKKLTNPKNKQNEKLKQSPATSSNNSSAILSNPEFEIVDNKEARKNLAQWSNLYKDLEKQQRNVDNTSKFISNIAYLERRITVAENAINDIAARKARDPASLERLTKLKAGIVDFNKEIAVDKKRIKEAEEKYLKASKNTPLVDKKRLEAVTTILDALFEIKKDKNAIMGGVVDKDGNLQAAYSYTTTPSGYKIDFLASAPWNCLPDHPNKKTGAGASAIEGMVKDILSKNKEGVALELEALPDAVAFYEKIGFTINTDKKDGLPYMTLSKENAQKFIEKQESKNKKDSKDVITPNKRKDLDELEEDVLGLFTVSTEIYKRIRK